MLVEFYFLIKKIAIAFEIIFILLLSTLPRKNLRLMLLKGFKKFLVSWPILMLLITSIISQERYSCVIGHYYIIMLRCNRLLTCFHRKNKKYSTATFINKLRS